jgi:hypothetical protein
MEAKNRPVVTTYNFSGEEKTGYKSLLVMTALDVMTERGTRE